MSAVFIIYIPAAWQTSVDRVLTHAGFHVTTRERVSPEGKTDRDYRCIRDGKCISLYEVIFPDEPKDQFLVITGGSRPGHQSTILAARDALLQHGALDEATFRKARGHPGSLRRLQELCERYELYTFPRPVFIPALLTVAVVYLAISQSSWWSLTALPFVWIGAMYATPNLNLVDGCLAYLSMLVGFILLLFFPPAGYAVLFGTTAGFYFSALESRMRARPASVNPVDDRLR